MVSVGTTYNSAVRSSNNKMPSSGVGLLSHGKSLYKIAIDHIASTLDSEKTWHSYMSVLQPPSSHRLRYVRLNPQLSEDPPRLDEVGRMPYIQEKVREDLNSDNKIQRVALQLIASSFYFEMLHSAEVAQDRVVQCKGINSLSSTRNMLNALSRAYILPIFSRQQRSMRAWKIHEG